jgi:hypothetical protein
MFSIFLHWFSVITVGEKMSKSAIAELVLEDYFCIEVD